MSIEAVGVRSSLGIADTPPDPKIQSLSNSTGEIMLWHRSSKH